LATACACDLFKSFTEELFFLCKSLDLFRVWVSFVELVPSSESLFVDNMVGTGVVFDLSFGCFFPIKLVPMFESGTLVSDKFDWFEFLVFSSCVVVCRD
jgi:hypothetical protein